MRKKNENKEVISKKQLSMDELDGVFFCEKELTLNLKVLPFIEDQRLKINEESKKKFDVTFSDEEEIIFYKNSLILIETKNSFEKKGKI